MYKDKNKQREANRAAQAKHRQGMTQAVSVIAEQPALVIPYVTPYKTGTKRGADIQCFADLPPDVQADIERYSRACKVDGIEYSREQNREARIARAIKYQHLFPNRFHQQGNSYTEKLPLPQGQFNRVSKPGDPDYDGPQGEGACKHCGKPTQSPLISCCYTCAIGLPLAGQQAETAGAEA